MSNAFDIERRELRRTRWIKPGVWHPADRFSREALRRLRQGGITTPAPAQPKGWEETARRYANDAAFYQGIVTEVGEILGAEAKTSDDGSVQDSVLALKVPGLVRQLRDGEPAVPHQAPEPGALDVEVDTTPTMPEPEPEGEALTPQQKLAARRARQNEKRKLERAAAKVST